MKRVIVVGDGMGDLPVEALGGRTPLEAASTPGFDRIARAGRVDRVQTVYRNLPIGSIVANLGILGYNPYETYPSGRASFEALGQGVQVEAGDLAFRCNLISLAGERIRDFTAGNIDDAAARTVLADLTLDFAGLEVELYPGMSYRNLLIVRGAAISAEEVVCYEPHTSIGEEIAPLLPQGRTRAARALLRPLRRALVDSIEQLAEINRKRGSQADMIWLWSPSSPPLLPDFRSRHGAGGAVVCAMDFLKGIGLAAGLETRHIPGANAYIDTNYRGKLNAALDYLERHDFLFVHVNAPDEEAHKRDVGGKVRSIELLDREIVSPLLDRLEERYPGSFRIALLPDHYTLVSDGTHGAQPVPVAWAGAGVHASGALRLTEREAARPPAEDLGRSFDFFSRYLGTEARRG